MSSNHLGFSTTSGKVKLTKADPYYCYHWSPGSTLDLVKCKAILTGDRHMFFTTTESESRIKGAIDEYGDSFSRDVTVDELKEVRRF